MFTKHLKVFSIIVVLLLVSFCGTGLAQDAKNAIYVEALGNGILYSINYDRMLTENISARIGYMSFTVSALTTGGDDVTISVIPIMVNYLMGEGSSKLELGAGVLIVSASADFEKTGSFEGSATGGTATIGYRYQPEDGGFVFRVGATPIFGEGGVAFWGGLSLGYAF